MNMIDTLPSTGQSTRTSAPRVVSIDIFRGLTMAVMIFVNELSEVKGLPWWTYHAPGNIDVMTYVDMVFPFFLFIVGMSMPLSITQRLKRNSSVLALWVHVIVRFLGLLVLGLILANAEKADPTRMVISGSTWALLGLISMALYLNVYVKSERYPAYSRTLRVLGLVGVVVLFALFRRTTHDGHAAWIDGSYPEILGLIAYSYLAVSILYIPTRRWAWASYAWFILLLALCVLSTGKMISFPRHIPLYFWPFSNGSMACIVMAGIITSSIFLGTDRRPDPRRAMSLVVGFGLLMLAAGRALTTFGISKIRATPTWSLYSIGASVLLFTLLYWICDVKQWTRWAFPVHAAGSNTLLTYLLPDLWYFLMVSMGVTFLDTHFSFGWPGVVKTLIFTFFILAVATGLTKAKVRLQL
jgi:heparan-alpha-glucosaminide N-acetyltransferase